MNDDYKTLGQIINEPATQFGSKELDSGNPHAWSAEKERQFEQDISDVQRNYTVTTEDLKNYIDANPVSTGEKIALGLEQAGTQIMDAYRGLDQLIAKIPASFPALTEQEKDDMVALTMHNYEAFTKARQDLINRKGIAESAWFNGANVLGQVALTTVAGVLTGGSTVPIVMGGVQEFGRKSGDYALKYAQATGDYSLKDQSVKDDIVALAYAGISAAIERGIGAERVLDGAIAQGAIKQLGKAAIGEAAEEFTQEMAEYMSDMTLDFMTNKAIYNDRTPMEAFKDALTGAVYGALGGGTMGFGMYYANRNALQRQFEAAGYAPADAKQMAINAVDTAKQVVLREIITRDQLEKKYGPAYQDLVNKTYASLKETNTVFGVRPEKENIGTLNLTAEQQTAYNAGQPVILNEQQLHQYADTVAAMLARQVMVVAAMQGTSTDMVLQLSDIEQIGNVMALNTPDMHNDVVVRRLQAQNKALQQKLKHERDLKKARNEGFQDEDDRIAILQAQQAALQRQLDNIEKQDQLDIETIKKNNGGIDISARAYADAAALKNATNADEFYKNLTPAQQAITPADQIQARYEEAILADIAGSPKEYRRLFMKGKISPQVRTNILTNVATLRSTGLAGIQGDIKRALDRIAAGCTLDNFAITFGNIRDENDINPFATAFVTYTLLSDPAGATQTINLLAEKVNTIKQNIRAGITTTQYQDRADIMSEALRESPLTADKWDGDTTTDPNLLMLYDQKNVVNFAVQKAQQRAVAAQARIKATKDQYKIRYATDESLRKALLANNVLTDSKIAQKYSHAALVKLFKDANLSADLLEQKSAAELEQDAREAKTRKAAREYKTVKSLFWSTKKMQYNINRQFAEDNQIDKAFGVDLKYFQKDGGIQDWGDIKMTLSDNGLIQDDPNNDYALTESLENQAKSLIEHNVPLNAEAAAQLDISAEEDRQRHYMESELLASGNFTQDQLDKMDLAELDAALQDVRDIQAAAATELDDVPFQEQVRPYTKATINIDGKERPTTNSNGDPIAMTEQGLRNFYKWFGDSKVVDEQGRPLVVYHGSADNFETFKEYNWGTYFTPDQGIAWSFGGTLYSIYIKAENPLIIDAKGKDWSSIPKKSIPKEIAKNIDIEGFPIDSIEAIPTEYLAIATKQTKKYDSLIIKNIKEHNKRTTDYITFESNQIKSVDNSGTFALDNNNIYYQGATEIARLDDIYPAYDRETIEVDGKQRTVYNSNGDRIAKSAEALTNFWRWFGDSKAVDNQGRPLVMYHGTESEFDTFKKNKISSNTGNFGMYGKGFYFTDMESTAKYYANFHGNKGIIIPVYLKLENPLYESEYKKDPEYVKAREKDGNDDLGRMINTAKYIQKIANQGKNDGVISINGEYVVFEPNQIKSTGNRGTFSETDNNIYYQEAYTAATINIDGKERTVYNSNGEPIATTEQGLRNFYKWFGDSKAVDNLGRPIVVYHGTNHKFQSFKKDQEMFFFSDNRNVADSYTDKDLIYNVYVRMENPLIIDAKHSYWQDIPVPSTIDKKELFGDFYKIYEQYGRLQQTSPDILGSYAIKKGYDGLIIKDVNDSSGTGTYGTDYITFKNTQQKSTDNPGLFGTDTAKLLFQGKRKGGAFDPITKQVILSRNSNTGTLPHEIAHFWLNEMFNRMQNNPNLPAQGKAMWDGLKRMLNITDDQTQLTRDQHEQFATSAEAYIFNKTPLPKGTEPAYKEFLAYVPESYYTFMNMGWTGSDGQFHNPMLTEDDMHWFDSFFTGTGIIESAPVQTKVVSSNEPVKVSIMDGRKVMLDDAQTTINNAGDKLEMAVKENIPAASKVQISSVQNAIVKTADETLQIPAINNDDKPDSKPAFSFLHRGRGTDTREEQLELTRKWAQEHWDEALAFALTDPAYSTNPSPADPATLIRVVAELNTDMTIKDQLNTNFALMMSQQGKSGGLNNDTHNSFFLKGLGQIQQNLANKYALARYGTTKDAVERFDIEVKQFIDRHMADLQANRITVQEVMKQAAEIFGRDENADISEEMNTLFQELPGQGTIKSSFVKEIQKVIKKRDETRQERITLADQMAKNGKLGEYLAHLVKVQAGAEMDTKTKAEFNAAATRAQVASTQLDSDDPDTATAAAQIIHEYHKRIGQTETAQNWADKVIGGYESRAMLSGATTISKNLVGNEIELAVVTGALRSKYGQNDVDETVIKAETDRLTKIYESSLLSIPQMENLTDKSLVHGEAYGIGDNSVTIAGVQVRTIGNTKIPDPLAILGRSDFYFRRNVYLKSLAYQASAYARKNNLNATDVFNQWKKLSNNTPDGIKARKEAVLTAHTAVFTQNGGLAEALNKVRNVLNRAIPLGTRYGLGNMIAPFVKTPANIVELGARALVSPVSSTWQYMKTGELDVAHRVDLGNLGVALLILAATVIAGGDYEPPYQPGLKYDPKKPYDSIRIAGVWIKLDTLGPLTTPLRLLLSAVPGISTSKNAWRRGVAGTFGDIPFDLDRVEYAITNPTKGGINWVEGEIDKAIPTIVSDWAKVGGHMAGITVDSPFESFGNKTIRRIGMDGQNPSVNDWIRAVGLGIIRIDENN